MLIPVLIPTSIPRSRTLLPCLDGSFAPADCQDLSSIFPLALIDNNLDGEEPEEDDEVEDLEEEEDEDDYEDDVDMEDEEDDIVIEDDDEDVADEEDDIEIEDDDPEPTKKS